ncbi:hypothetical protein H5410_020663 [Solanum commersonii]|uniref:RRM domain-containing protein n=1 Tax=Solanum commersonii TaxID=4109 RepID=A0A9J5ZEX9_SOLCO|nr:hypothetical protein H5410_020663 [Solanum commersonii]
MQRFNEFFLNYQTPLARFVTSRRSCSKLFIGGLCYDTNEPILKQAFEQHGETIEVKVICEHKSGKSKGYGFVKFTSETAASKALKEMDGQVIIGWKKYSHQLCPQRMTLRGFNSHLSLQFPVACNSEDHCSIFTAVRRNRRKFLIAIALNFLREETPIHIPQLFAMDSRRSMQAFQITGILPEVKSGLLGRS